MVKNWQQYRNKLWNPIFNKTTIQTWINIPTQRIIAIEKIRRGSKNRFLVVLYNRLYENLGVVIDTSKREKAFKYVYSWMKHNPYGDM